MTADAAIRQFIDRLGLSVPIVQAPMANSQTSALAIAAGDGGALGSLPGAALTPAALHDEVGAVRSRGARAVNVNFFAHQVPLADAAREQAWRAALKPYFDELGLDQAAIPSGPGPLPFGEEAVEAVEFGVVV